MGRETDFQFSKNTESLIKSLGKGEAADDTAGCRECSICLGSVLVSYRPHRD
jgi:heterodisulfide reductase subunit C